MAPRVVLASQGPVPGLNSEPARIDARYFECGSEAVAFTTTSATRGALTTTPIETLFPPGLDLTEHLAAEIAVFPNPCVLIRMNHDTGTKGP